MSIRKMALVAAIGTSMASAPVMAQTQSPVVSPASVERSGASLDQANAQTYGFPWLIIFVVIAVGAGIYFAVNDDDDAPVSP